jgi:hypothetical protein
VVAVAGAVVWAIWPPSDAVFLDYVSAMCARGEPLTVDALAGPMPPHGENAAPELDAALSWVEGTLGGESKWPAWVIGQLRKDAPKQSAAVEFADRLAPFAERAERALTRPRCRFRPTVVRRDADRMAPVTSELQVAVLLGTRARFAGDFGERVAACRTLAQFACRLETIDPVEWDIALDAMHLVVWTLRSEVESGTSVGAARAPMDAALAASWLPRGASRWRRRRVEFIQGFAEDPHRVVPPLSDRLASLFAFRSPRPGGDPWPAAEVVACCEFLRKAAGLPTTSFVEWSSAYRHVDVPGRHAAYVPRELELMRTLSQTDAACRLARVALAVAERRAVDGDFPATLDALRPMFADGVPLDPFTDTPFVYERTPTGVRIASVGRLPEDAPLDEPTLRERCLVWDLKR